MGLVPWCHTTTPYYEKMVELVKEAEEAGLINFCCRLVNDLKPESSEQCKDFKLDITAKEIYKAYTSDFPPPRVELSIRRSSEF